MKQSPVLTALIVLLIVPLAWASTAKASEITEKNKAAFSQEHYDLLIKSVITARYKLFITSFFMKLKPLFSGLTLPRESFKKAPASLGKK